MKQSIFSYLIAGLWATTALAQTAAPTSGKITYEGMRQIDRSQLRMVINGQEVRPGSGDAPEGLPDVMSFTQKLVFSGTMAREERDRPQGAMFRRNMDGGGAQPDGSGERPSRPRNVNFTSPMAQQTYLDLATRTSIDMMTLTKDSVKTTYRADRPLPRAEGWQLSDKTKKIAGYVCHKATVAYRPVRQARGRAGVNGATAPAEPASQAPAEPYTIWYTTDLGLDNEIVGLTWF